MKEPHLAHIVEFFFRLY